MNGNTPDLGSIHNRDIRELAKRIEVLEQKIIDQRRRFGIWMPNLNSNRGLWLILPDGELVVYDDWRMVMARLHNENIEYGEVREIGQDGLPI